MITHEYKWSRRKSLESGIDRFRQIEIPYQIHFLGKIKSKSRSNPNQILEGWQDLTGIDGFSGFFSWFQKKIFFLRFFWNVKDFHSNFDKFWEILGKFANLSRNIRKKRMKPRIWYPGQDLIFPLSERSRIRSFVPNPGEWIKSKSYEIWMHLVGCSNLDSRNCTLIVLGCTKLRTRAYRT